MTRLEWCVDMLDETVARAVPVPRDEGDEVEARVGRTADALLKWTALAERYERTGGARPTAEARARVDRLRTAATLARRSLLTLATGP